MSDDDWVTKILEDAAKRTQNRRQSRITHQPYTPKKRPWLERLYARIHPEPNSGCWLWSGAHRSNGYGYARNQEGKVGNIHRIVWELEVGPIPVGLDLDHKCRNPACVNPEHLEPVTRQVNLGRGKGAEVSRNRMMGNQHWRKRNDKKWYLRRYGRRKLKRLK